jgi:predicted DNA-binding transcriptional regulator AlpA
MDTDRSIQLLRIKEVSKLTSLGKTTINLWVATGRFPPPIVLSKTIKVWRHSDIERWLDSIQGSPETNDSHAGIDDENPVGLRVLA